MAKVKMCVLLLASTAWTPAYAQTRTAEASPNAAKPQATGDTSELPDIVVTAQKRSERINDVPLAITAIGADQLSQQGVRETGDLARLVPSFTMQTSIFNIPIYRIRGVGFADISANTSPAVSIYVDEVPLPYSVMTRGALLDLERVEVLKGPQGTLFGESSTGGAVNYIAAKPTSELHYGGDLSYGRFNTVNGSAFLSAPITDTLGIRVALQGDRGDDWQYSLTRNDTRGQKRFYNGRVILAWRPSPSVSFNLSVQGWRDRSDTQAPQFFLATPQNPQGYQPTLAALAAAVPAPKNDRAADWDPGSPTAGDDKFYQIALRGTVELAPSIELTSITSYSNLNLYRPNDLDGLPYRDLFVEERTRVKHLSQELRVAGTGGKFNWLIGGIYERDSNSDSSLSHLANTSNNVFGIVFDTGNQINDNPAIKTYAAFGSLEYKLTNAVTARVSARYTNSDDQHRGCFADGGNGKASLAFSVLSTFLSGTPTTIAPGQCLTLNSSTFKPGLVPARLREDNVSWRAGLDWKISANTLLYGNVAKGYKAGSFTSVPAVFDTQLKPVKQESVLAYEVGLKTNLAGNKLHLDLSAFYYDYRDKQLQGYAIIVPFGPLAALVSVPKSRVYGAEVELTAAVTSLLRVRMSGSYIKSEVRSNPAVPISPFGTPTSFIGESFPDSPKVQANFDIEQRIPLSSNAEAFLGGDVTYRSSASAAFGRNAGPLERSALVLPSYTLLDLRAGVRFNDGRDVVELWGRNVTNEFYLNGITSTDATVRFTGMPAMYGIRVSHRF